VSQKRVLAVVRHPVGGVRTHIIYTYPLLSAAGYRFTFVIPQHESYATFREQVASWEGAEIVEAPYRNGYRRSVAFGPVVRRLLRQRRFSLVHSHGLQAAIPSIFANLRFRVPHVMTSQDVFERLGLSGIANRTKLFALGQVLRRLDALIAVSEDTRRDHLQHLPALKHGRCRVEMIHNGIPVDEFTKVNTHAQANLRDRLSIGHDVFLIGFLGRFMEQKGFLVLLDALSRLIRLSDIKPFHLVAVGSGDMLVNYQRDLVSKPELSAHLSFLEHTPDPAPILRELDLLVMPSLWEAHPLLPMEAMTLGTPVLGSDCIGLCEVLKDTPSKMVPTNDAAALANGILEAIASPWTEQAIEFVPAARERFDVRHTANQLCSLFDQLVIRTAASSGTHSLKAVNDHSG